MSRNIEMTELCQQIDVPSPNFTEQDLAGWTPNKQLEDYKLFKAQRKLEAERNKKPHWIP